MTINKLGGNRVLIILGRQDMTNYALDYSCMNSDDSHSMRVLSALSRTACLREGIAVKGRRLCVEALGFSEDCYLLVTVGRVYRRKKGGAVCYGFETAGALLDAAEALSKSGLRCSRTTLYRFAERYYLVFGYPNLPKRARILLSEFDAKKCPSLTAAALREHGEELCRRNALERLCGEFRIES